MLKVIISIIQYLVSNKNLETNFHKICLYEPFNKIRLSSFFLVISYYEEMKFYIYTLSVVLASSDVWWNIALSLFIIN